MQFNRNNIILVGSLVILVLIVWRVVGIIQSQYYGRAIEQGRIDKDQFNAPLSTATIGETKLFVEIADTPEKKSKGLGGRTFLADDYGMLFPSENQPYLPVFWMKGMEVPIDIIWIKDS
ncbi:MAG: DUF192 domain-containing protein, partial [Candidatus Roizmanbacteria bacterium]|nr:DUF192 domain-containing protein [Candidatus Roizmanbacteria bacterium]